LGGRKEIDDGGDEGLRDIEGVHHSLKVREVDAIIRLLLV